jgi:PDZ domain-containing protein
VLAPPQPQPRRRRILRPKTFIILFGVVALVALSLERMGSGYDLLMVDRAHPVAPLVHVAGGHEPRNGGGIYYVDVLIRQASELEDLFGGLHSGSSLIKESVVNGPGVSNAQEQQEGVYEMETSQEIAAAVALHALGKKVTISNNGALVEEVEPGMPAYRRLGPADVIVGIDGKKISTPKDVSDAMSGKPVGTKFTFSFLRGKQKRSVLLTTVPAKPGSKRGVVGIYVGPNQEIHLPIKVSIDAHDVGGPSAGLAFALEVLQQLGRNVDHGHKIAATGEIYLNGQVGAIGGIKQKTIGAREAGVEAFLVPTANAATARKYADGLRIIPVKNFQQALQALATLPSNG